MALFKRRQFIIYPKFQYTLIATNLIILSTTLVFVLVLLTQSIRYLRNLAINADMPEDHVFYQMLEVHESAIYINLTIAAILSIVVSTILTVILSHKISGPIIRLKGHLKRFIETSKYEKLFFRKNDFFSDLPDLVNTSLIRISDKNEDNNDTDIKD